MNHHNPTERPQPYSCALRSSLSVECDTLGHSSTRLNEHTHHWGSLNVPAGQHIWSDCEAHTLEVLAMGPHRQIVTKPMYVRDNWSIDHLVRIPTTIRYMPSRIKVKNNFPSKELSSILNIMQYIVKRTRSCVYFYWYITCNSNSLGIILGSTGDTSQKVRAHCICILINPVRGAHACLDSEGLPAPYQVLHRTVEQKKKCIIMGREEERLQMIEI